MLSELAMLSRRTLLASTGSWVGSEVARVPSPSLRTLIAHPLLRKMYSRGSGKYDAQFNAGLNASGGFKILEEQRQGTEWIISGIVARKPEWIALGWNILDRGLSFQSQDGGFGRWSYFHSTSLFVEALARAMLLDPSGATPKRIDALRRSTLRLADPDPKEQQWNEPYTHRRYILAAAFGESSAVLHIDDASAQLWASRGLALQRPDGVNPEAGGYDLSYQIVGPLHALRYLPVCRTSTLAAALKTMVRKAVEWELPRISEDGSIDSSSSTRIGHEQFGHEVKAMNYRELFEVLVYGAQLIEPTWIATAERVGLRQGWI